MSAMALLIYPFNYPVLGLPGLYVAALPLLLPC